MFCGMRDGFSGADEVLEGRDRLGWQGWPYGHIAPLSDVRQPIPGAFRNRPALEMRDGAEERVSGGSIGADSGFPASGRGDEDGDGDGDPGQQRTRLPQAGSRVPI